MVLYGLRLVLVTLPRSSTLSSTVSKTCLFLSRHSTKYDNLLPAVLILLSSMDLAWTPVLVVESDGYKVAVIA